MAAKLYVWKVSKLIQIISVVRRMEFTMHFSYCMLHVSVNKLGILCNFTIKREIKALPIFRVFLLFLFQFILFFFCVILQIYLRELYE